MNTNKKKEYSLTPFYFPTQIILIDDDPAFLNLFETEIALELEYDNLASYDSPMNALDYLEKFERMPIFSTILSGKIKGSFDFSPENYQLDKKMVFKFLKSYERFNEVSTAVVDYAMPEMNGITFCNYLNQRIKRIILTGMGNQADAIRAFNSGTINKYLDKADEAIVAKIANFIKINSEDYFKEICGSINSYLGKSHFLNDKSMVIAYKELCKQHDLIEHYLISPSHLLCLNKKGDLFLLVAENNETLMAHTRIAKNRGAPVELINKIEGKHYVPYFPTDDSYFNSSIINWRDSLYDKTVIPGKNIEYHCAFIENPNIPGISADEIFHLMSSSLNS